MPLIDTDVEATEELAPGRFTQVPLRRALELRGPLVRVVVNLPPTRVEELARAGKQAPRALQGFAVIDTGARTSGICMRVVRSLGLVSTEVGQTSDVRGAVERPIYTCSIEVHDGAFSEAFFMERVFGVELTSMGVLAMLGRDFLRNKLLVYCGKTGRFQLSW